MLNSLTSFRFFAAMLVLLWHLGFQKIQFGYIGVSFFFILSGFILTYNYSHKFTTLSKKQIEKFYIARFSKIYPVHLLTFLLSIPLTIHITNNIKIIIAQIVTAFFNIFLIQTYIPIQWINFSFNGVSWSLSNELVFYLFFPFLILIILKFSKNIINIFFLICILFSLYLLFIAEVSFNRVVPLDDWLLYMFPLVRLLDFTIGICLGVIFLHFKDRRIKNKDISRKTFTCLEFSTVFLFIISCVSSTDFPQQFKFSIFYIPSLCFLIYIFAFQRGFLSKILSAKPIIFLGEISFSFYMVHLLVIRYLELLLTNTLVIDILTFVITLIWSSIIYLYYEEPLRKFIRFGNKNNIKMRYKNVA